MKLYYVYILECSDSSYYTGITNDISRRIKEHNSGVNKSCYTFNRRPLKLKFQQNFNDIEQAISLEKKIKGWSRYKKKALIENNIDKLKVLSECKNETHFKNNDQSN